MTKAKKRKYHVELKSNRQDGIFIRGCVVDHSALEAIKQVLGSGDRKTLESFKDLLFKHATKAMLSRVLCEMGIAWDSYRAGK